MKLFIPQYQMPKNVENKMYSMGYIRGLLKGNMISPYSTDYCGTSSGS